MPLNKIRQTTTKHWADCFPTVLLFGLLALALATKCIYLGEIPGINADEAYWAVRLREFADGVGEWPWTPPTSRLMNPIYPALIWFVNTIFPPGFEYLRLIAVFSHFALLLVAFLTINHSDCREDRLVFVLLLAVLPLHTVFARVAWEPCLIPLFAYLIIYFSIRHQMINASIAMICGVLIHPTLFFLAPIQFIIWLHYLYVTPIEQRQRRRQWIAMIVVLEVIFAALFYAVHTLLNEQNFYGLWLHILNYQKLIESFAWYAYSAAGFTSFIEFTSASTPSLALEALIPIGCIVIAFFVSLTYLFFLKRKQIAVLVTLGLFCSLILFYIATYFHGALAQLNENWVWEAGYQRFVLWASVPTVWVLYELLSILNIRRAGGIVIAATALTFTLSNYFFKAIEQHEFIFPPVYATAMVEPKKAAYAWIQKSMLQENKPDNSQAPQSTHFRIAPTKIVAEDWWLFWPGRYWLSGSGVEFSYYDQGVKTFFPEQYQALSFLQVKQVFEGNGYIVTFAASPLAQEMRAAGLGRYITYIAKAGDGSDLILVWHDAKK